MSLLSLNQQKQLIYRLMANLPGEMFLYAWCTMYNSMGETFKVDVSEEIQHYVVEAEMPGVQKTDVTVEFQDAHLLISVNYKEAANEQNDKYVHRERCCSSTKRSVYLAGAKGSGITVSLTDGVLLINVPKEDACMSTKAVKKRFAIEDKHITQKKMNPKDAQIIIDEIIRPLLIRQDNLKDNPYVSEYLLQLSEKLLTENTSVSTSTMSDALIICALCTIEELSAMIYHDKTLKKFAEEAKKSFEFKNNS